MPLKSCISQVLHLATTLSRRPLRTQHGIICPDCKQEVAHECYFHSINTLPSLHQSASTLANPAGLQTHFTGPTAQENVFGTVPRLTVTSPSGPTSAYPPSCLTGPSIAVHSQYNSSNVDIRLEKRDLHPSDLECEPER